MNNIKIKKLIISIVILIICIFLLLISLVFINKKSNNNENTIQNNEIIYTKDGPVKYTEDGKAYTPEIPLNDSFDNVIKDHKTYFMIKNILNTYITYMKQINGDQTIEVGRLQMTEEEIKKSYIEGGIKAIYNIIDPQYIQDIGVDNNKIIEKCKKYMKIGNYTENVIYDLDIENIFIKEISEEITIALIYSEINNAEFNIILKIDLKNRTYTMFWSDYIENNNYDQTLEQSGTINSDNIENNGFNFCIIGEIDDRYIVLQLFYEFKNKLFNNSKAAYDLLNEEYREKKFETYSEFEEYIEKNKKKLNELNIEQFEIKEYEEYREYICIDQSGNYFIFDEKNPIEYTVLLDTYTIDLPEFLEKYNNASEDKKVGYNIEKVFTALNLGDYKYVYNKIDETFKNNNFNTLEAFEKYIQEKLYSNNSIEYEDYKIQGNLYIYTINIKDGDNKNNSDVVKMNIIMQLQEGTDFVMSFSIE